MGLVLGLGFGFGSGLKLGLRLGLGFGLESGLGSGVGLGLSPGSPSAPSAAEHSPLAKQRRQKWGGVRDHIEVKKTRPPGVDCIPL